MNPLSTVVVITNSNGAESTINLNELNNPVGSSIVLALSPQQVADATRAGNDLVLTLTSGQIITIPGFFTDNPATKNELILKDDEGVLWLGQYEEEFAGFAWVTSNDGSAMGWWLAAGLVGAAMAASSGSGGSGMTKNKQGGDSGDDQDNEAPNNPTVIFNQDGSEISGKAEPGSQVTVYDKNGLPIVVTEADPVTGEYRVELPTPLQNGETVIVTATDKAGNESNGTEATAPDITAPEVTLDDLATRDTTPSLSGTVDDPDAVITVTVDGKTYTATNHGDGTWSLPDNLIEPLGEGSHTVTVTATDKANNTATVTHDIVILPDTLGAYDVPTVSVPQAEDGHINDEEMASGITVEVGLPDIAKAGQTVVVTLTDELGQEHTVTHEITDDEAESGQVTLVLTDVLPDGDYQLEVHIRDDAGNRSADSQPVDFTLDTTIPPAPHVELAEDTGAVDGVTAVPTVNVSNIEPDATWEYSTDGGETWTEGSGQSFELEHGEYADGDIVVRQTDPSGNISPTSSLPAITVDTQSPGGDDGQTKPILVIQDDNGELTAAELEAGVEARVTLTPGTQAGDTVTLTLTSPVGPDQVFNYTVKQTDIDNPITPISFILPDDLSEGEYTAEAIITDRAGNASQPSGPVDFSVTYGIDQTGDGVVRIESITDDTGTLDDFITYDNRLIIEGRVDSTDLIAGRTFTVTIDNVTYTLGQSPELTITSSASGHDTWTLDLTTKPALADGTYQIVSRVTEDSTGRFVSHSATLTIDTAKPDAPTLKLAEDTGVSSSDGVTNNPRVVVEGLEPDATWEYKIGTDDWEPGTGTDFMLPPGTYAAGDIQVRQTDTAGNVSDPGVMGSVVIDLTAPSDQSPVVEIVEAADGFVNASELADGIQVIVTLPQGSAENDQVIIRLIDANNNETEYSYPLDDVAIANGTVQIIIPKDALSEGAYQLDARIEDPAGNATPESVQVGFILDSIAPVAPSLDMLVAPAEGTTFFTDGRVSVTNLETDATWEYSLNGGSDWLPGIGTTFELPADGTYPEGSIQVRQTDAAGNTSPARSLVETTVDSSSPGNADGLGKPTLTVLDAVSDVWINRAENTGGIRVQVDLTEGTRVGDKIRINVEPAIDGYAPEHVITLLESVTGTAIFRIPSLTTDGSYEVSAYIIDSVGNRSLDSDPDSFNLDITVPDTPVLSFAKSAMENDLLVSNGEIAIANLEDGNTWQYSVNGGASWLEPELDDAILLPEGSYAAGSVMVRQKDPAGNLSGQGVLAGPFIVDLTRPGGEEGLDEVTITIHDADDNWVNGLEASDGIQVTIGLTEGSRAGDVLVINMDPEGGDAYPITPDHVITPEEFEAGRVNITLNGPFNNDVYTLHAFVKDVLNQQSAVATSDKFEVDTVAPNALLISLVDDTGAIDGITSNPLVKVEGIEVGATWEYSLNGGQTWQTGAEPFSGTAASEFPLVDGTTYAAGQILVRQTDKAGNVSPSSALGQVVIDTVSPGGTDNEEFAPTISIPEAVNSIVNKQAMADGMQVRVQLTDTTQTGDSLRITVKNLDTNQNITVPVYIIKSADVADVSDKYAFVTLPSSLLPDAQYQLSAVISDRAGGFTPPSNLLTVTVDKTPPSPPLLELHEDTLGPDGVLNNGITSNGEIKVSGLESGATWEYSLNGGLDWLPGTSTGTSGTFNIDVNGTYLEGMIRVRQTDLAGNRSDEGQLNHRVVFDDVDPEAVPVLVINTGADTFANAAEFSGNGLPITVTFDAEKAVVGDYVQVEISHGATTQTLSRVLTGLDRETGSVQFYLQTPLGQGSHSAVAYIVDLAGNKTPSDAVGFNADTQAPEAPITQWSEYNGANGNVTLTGVVDVSGIETGATWRYSLNGGVTWVDGNGGAKWEEGDLEQSFIVPEGVYPPGVILVQQIDQAGNPSPSSAPLIDMEVDTSHPGGPGGTDVPTLFIPEAEEGWLNAADVVDGRVAIEVGLTEGTRVGDTITLTFAASLAFQYQYVIDAEDRSSGKAVFYIPHDTSGSTGLPTDNNYVVTATISDKAGNTSASSTPLPLGIDTAGPGALNLTIVGADHDVGDAIEEGEISTAAVIVTLPTDVNAGDSIKVILTRDGQPPISLIDREVTAADLLDSRQITLPLPNSMVTGEYTVSGSVTDRVGNPGDNAIKEFDVTRQEGALLVKIDAVVPDNGFPANDWITNTVEVAIKGTVTTNLLSVAETMVLLIGGEDYSDQVEYSVEASGVVKWTLNLELEEGALSEGINTVVASITTDAGTVSDNKTLVIDTTVATPTLALVTDTGTPDGVTANPAVRVYGLEDGATWEYSVDGGVSWTASPQPWHTGQFATFNLAAGHYAANRIQVRQTDVAGNVSDAGKLASDVTVDTTAPAKPVLEFVDDTNSDGVLNASENTANANGLIDVKVILGADTQAGDQLIYKVNGGAETTRVITAGDLTDGFKISYTALAEGGQITFTAHVVDRAGNTTDPVTGTLRKDTIGPEQPDIAVQFVDGDGYINNLEKSAVTLTGKLADGVTLEGLVVRDSQGKPIDIPASTITIGADYTFTVGGIDLSTLADGNLQVTMTVKDSDGNTSTRTDVSTLMTNVSVAITSISTNTGEPNDFVTTDQTLTIRGTTNVGSAGALTATINGVTYRLGVDPELTLTGSNWTLNLEGAPLADGTHTLVVEATDAAGNPLQVSKDIVIEPVVAHDDEEQADLGEFDVQVHAMQTASNVSVLRLAEATDGTDAETSFAVQENNKGSVAITIKQAALAAVADAFVLEIYNASGQLVYSAVTDPTDNSNLLGDVGGVTVLGALGSDSVVAVIHGLTEGVYRVVIRNDESQLAQLLDPDGNGISLTELGAAGMVLGPHNQNILLTAVETTLNGKVGEYGSPGLGTLVKNVIGTLLTGAESVNVGDLVGWLNASGLVVATGLADQLLADVAKIFLSNLLTVLQYTDIDIALTEYALDGAAEVAGNFFDNNSHGADQVAAGAIITHVKDVNDKPVEIASTGETRVAGNYGVLWVKADGSYRYEANGNPESIDQSEQFTYTLRDPSGRTASAQLTVQIDGAATLFEANDDRVLLNQGELESAVQAPILASDVQFVGLLEGSNAEVMGIPFTVTDEYLGDVVIDVSQMALVSIADAVRIDVLNDRGEVVYSGVSSSSLLGNVAGVSVLGLTGNNSLVANVNGLTAGDYSVVIYQDQNLAAQLLDGFSLSELGDAGVVLGPENQKLILDSVQEGLGDNVLASVARGLLEVVLATTNGLGVASLVDIVETTLTDLGIAEPLVDNVINTIASNLVANLLTVLQTTDVSIGITDYRFLPENLITEGNVILGAVNGDGDGADQLVAGSVVTQVQNADGQTVTVLGTGEDGVQIHGRYGVLTIYENGDYQYVAYGVRDGLGQQDEFTYTVTSGGFAANATRVTDSAKLTFALDGDGLSNEIALASVPMKIRVEEGEQTSLTRTMASSNKTVDFSVDANTTQSFIMNFDRIGTVGVGEEIIIALKRFEGASWKTYQSIDVSGFLLSGGDAVIAFNDLKAGQYQFDVQYKAGLLSGGSFALSFTPSITYLNEMEVNLLLHKPITGNLLENDIIRQDESGIDKPFTFWVEKHGAFVELDSDPETAAVAVISVTGLYGTLTLHSNGDYSYLTRTDLALSDFVDPQPEKFTYQVNYGDRVETAELTVNVVPSGYQAVALALDDSSIVLVESGSGALSGKYVADMSDEDILHNPDPDRLTLHKKDLDDLIALEQNSDVLVIQGDSEDTLDLSQVVATKGATSTVGGTLYQHYTVSDHTLWVQDGINVVEAP